MVKEKVWTSKDEVRAELKARINALPKSEVEKAQQALNGHLNTFLSQQTGRWGAYRPKSGEISPLSSIQQNKHLRWVYPRVHNSTLEFFLEPKVWLNGSFGIEEPDPTASEQVDVQTLSGFLVPGLGFDGKGTRLGRGRGFFDRALEHFQGLKVGIALDHQVYWDAVLPRESFDIPMDVIVTDRGVKLINDTEGDRRND